MMYLFEFAQLLTSEKTAAAHLRGWSNGSVAKCELGQSFQLSLCTDLVELLMHILPYIHITYTFIFKNHMDLHFQLKKKITNHQYMYLGPLNLDV